MSKDGKDGMCVVITGSASGLGAATAASLAKGGARIVINYSSSQKEAEQTADLCRTAGAEVAVVQGDVSRDEDCKKIVAAAAPWGRLDALINNAGTTKHMAHGNLDGLSAEDFQRLFGVNTIGPFQMIRAARALLEAGANASGASVGGGQHIVRRRHQRRRLIGRLRREQGCAEYHHVFAGAGAGAADPRQHRMSRATSIRPGSPRAAARPAPSRCATWSSEKCRSRSRQQRKMSRQWCAFSPCRPRAT